MLPRLFKTNCARRRSSGRLQAWLRPRRLPSTTMPIAR
jgi:hypothetical protein